MVWLDPLGLGVATVLNFAPRFDLAHLRAAKPGLVAVIGEWAHPIFRAKQREVSNWRVEAARGLEVSVDTRLRLFIGVTRESVPRCVRLNNYWCIKKAGWAGEIAADGDGHVAFASAREGAIVAAKLLRRYYMDFGRHNALAIVSHWAPPQCGLIAFSPPPRRRAPALAGHSLSRLDAAEVATGRKLSPDTVHHPLKSLEPALRALARLDAAETVRARWLAQHPARGLLRRAAEPAPRLRAADEPDVRVPTKVPAIMAGGQDISLTPVSPSALGAFDVAPSSRPLTSCSDDGKRIRNYAIRAIEGIAQSPDEDLQLFSADGVPSAHLLPLMVNMAKVEIGPLGARQALIAAAIAAAFPGKRTDAETTVKPSP